MFHRLASRGVLKPGDARLAAAHYNWLVMSIPLNQALLLRPEDFAAGQDDCREAFSTRPGELGTVSPVRPPGARPVAAAPATW